MPKITVANEKKDFEVPAGENLREALRSHGVAVYPGMARYFNCLGNGQCGACKVIVKSGAENLSPKTLLEKLTLMRMLSAIGHESDMRLSCQCKVQGDVAVESCPSMNLSGEVFWEKKYPNK